MATTLPLSLPGLTIGKLFWRKAMSLRHLHSEGAVFLLGDVRIMSNYLSSVIRDYELDILGNTYIFRLGDGNVIRLGIAPENVPHLLGIWKLPSEASGNWYPESLLVLNRDVTAYIDNQIPVTILEMTVESNHPVHTLTNS